MTRRQFLVLIVPLMAVLVGFLVLLLVEREGGPQDPPWDLDFAEQVRTSMADEFVWGVPQGRKGWEAYFKALNAWVATFDPYGAVIAPWDVAAMQEQSSGQYYGIGIRIRPPSTLEEGKPLEKVEVVGVKPKGPADKAGVRIGDWIVGVDGKRVPDLCPTGDDTALQKAVRGKQGSQVVLRLRAPDGAEREVAAVRAKIDSGSIFGVRLLDAERGIGYIRINAFQASTSRDFRAACDKLEKEGLQALVLDLRHDGGGLLDQAVAVADSLLEGGVIVRQRGRRGRFTEVRRATAATALDPKIPLAVLIDGGSASASEILAGALQDRCRGVLVGERSYGKFLVQMIEKVPMRIGAVLFKRTTSVYETPLGHQYARTSKPGEADYLAGIQPEVYVPISREERTALRRVFGLEAVADWNPKREPDHTKFVDRQLETALALLRSKQTTPRIVAATAHESAGNRHIVR